MRWTFNRASLSPFSCWTAFIRKNISICYYSDSSLKIICHNRRNLFVCLELLLLWMTSIFNTTRNSFVHLQNRSIEVGSTENVCYFQNNKRRLVKIFNHIFNDHFYTWSWGKINWYRIWITKIIKSHIYYCVWVVVDKGEFINHVKCFSTLSIYQSFQHTKNKFPRNLRRNWKIRRPSSEP